MGQLDIKIVKAKSLPTPKISETKIPNAFVRIIFYDNKSSSSSPASDEKHIYETSVVYASHNPSWPQEVFKIQFSQEQQQNVSNLRLTLQVWHKDVFVNDELLGECDVDMAGLVRASVRSELLPLVSKKSNNDSKSNQSSSSCGELSVKLLALDFGREEPNNNNNSSLNSTSEYSAGDPFENQNGSNANKVDVDEKQQVVKSNNNNDENEEEQPRRRQSSSTVLQNLDQPTVHEQHQQQEHDNSNPHQEQQQEPEKSQMSSQIIDDAENNIYNQDETSPNTNDNNNNNNVSAVDRTTPQQALFGGDGEPISIRKLVEEKLEARRKMKEQRQQKQKQQKMIATAAASPSPSQQHHQQQKQIQSRNPDDPYFALIKKAMDKEEKQRTISKKKLHENVKKIHGGSSTPNKNNGQLVVVASSPSTPQKLSTKHSRFAVASATSPSLSEQQQQQKRELHFNTSPAIPSTSSMPTNRDNNNSNSSDQKQKSLNMHDPREIRTAIKACVDAEANRALLTEAEAKALSNGKISYSISQRTTAFGNHTVSNGDTAQEAFCYLCVSIAKALIPGNNASTDKKSSSAAGGGVSHCTMIRKVSSFLSNPVWASKLSSSGDATSSMISLLAHGSIDVKDIQDEEREKKMKKKQEKHDEMIEGKETDQEEEEEEENFSRVQWALIHTAVDSPTLFISLHCPPAVEILYPVDAPAKGDKANADGMYSNEQKEELHNYYLEKTRKENHDDENKQGENEEKDEKKKNDENVDPEIETTKTNNKKKQQQKVHQKNENDGLFAHRFVDTVFHNIGIDNNNNGDNVRGGEGEQDYDNENEFNNDEDYDVDDGEHSHNYEYACEFVDEIFGRLLNKPSSRNHGEEDDDENQDEQQKEEGEEGDEEINDLILYANNNNHHNENKETNNNDKKKKFFVNQNHIKIYQTIRDKLRLPPTHEAVAVHLCFVVEEFLSSESHGRKIKRIVVCSHESTAELGGHVVMALRERMLQNSKSNSNNIKNKKNNNTRDEANQNISSVSKRVIAITTNANLASSVPRRRNNSNISSNKKQNSADNNKNDTEAANQSPPPPPPSSLFSQQSPRDRALFLRSFFARLCVPVPKLSFDPERRRGWRFVVMPDCLEWALAYHAPIALLNYQAREFPKNRFEVDDHDDHRKEQEDKAKEEQKQIEDNNNNQQLHQIQNEAEKEEEDKKKRKPRNYYSHPPTIDEVISNLWQALANVEGALDPVTGGCTLAGFILGATTLMNGLVSKQVNDSIWNEVYEIVLSQQEAANNNTNKKNKNDSSSSSKSYSQNYYHTGSSSSPPLCQCYRGALPPEYFSARETSFIKRMKMYRHRVSTNNNNNNNSSSASSRMATATRTSTIPTEAIKSYLLRSVATRPFDAAVPPNADQDWIQSFFSQSFHEPHQILSKVNAKFLPPLSSTLSTTVTKTATTTSSSPLPIHRNYNNDDDDGMNNNNKNSSPGQSQSVQRMNETYLKEGAKNATLVRLRLEERIERAEYMQSRMQ